MIFMAIKDGEVRKQSSKNNTFSLDVSLSGNFINSFSEICYFLSPWIFFYKSVVPHPFLKGRIFTNPPLFRTSSAPTTESSV